MQAPLLMESPHPLTQTKIHLPCSPKGKSFSPHPMLISLVYNILPHGKGHDAYQSHMAYSVQPRFSPQDASALNTFHREVV